MRQIISAHGVFGLEMTDHGFDGGAPSDLAFDLGRAPALLAGRIDPELIIGWRIVAAVVGVGEQALDGVADHVFAGMTVANVWPS
jgi:hypothetical protein